MAPVMDATAQPAPPWHARSIEEVAEALGSHCERGLSEPEAASRLRRDGPNALAEPRSPSLLAVLLAQLRSPLIYLLFVAAAVALWMGHRSDAAVILVVVGLNTVIGAVQEGRAERSLSALRRLASRKARVLRGGAQRLIEAREVVVGDVLLLEAGDAVAADARVIEHASLRVSEASLTGESVPTDKGSASVAAEAQLADRTSVVHAGTYVTSGRARVLVVATGTATEIGAIATLAQQAEEPLTPLERRIAQVGRFVIGAAVLLFVLLLAIGVVRGVPWSDLVMVGISQLVGMIPEGLPVAMTIALSVGVQQMARKKCVVRRLSAVETLGSTTVICTDKTGTLTRNEMTVTELRLGSGRALDASGVGYRPEGELHEGGSVRVVRGDPDLLALVEAALLCNDAELRLGGDGSVQPLGDPTEVALLTLAHKAGANPDEVRRRSAREGELPFDSAAQMMATQHRVDGRPRIMIKGAPELVLRLCSARLCGGRSEAMGIEERRAAEEAVAELAGRALRVLAFAWIDDAAIDPQGGFAALPTQAVLLGFTGQIDPPRPEVGEAVARCRQAGIRPVMVTGDHQATARAIAAELGIADEADLALDGRELSRLDDRALAACIGRVAVFARVHPAQKLRIVEAYQARGEVVAMTGDGVNDAPALVRANVGVAMGITGTEVAKEAAKIVLVDDNFATLVSAVEAGRVVYRNIQKTVLLLFSTSAAEVLVLMLAMLFGYPPPFAAVQILWNNLVTEGVITVNLAMEPAEGDEMRDGPVAPDEPLLTRSLVLRMASMTSTIALSTLGWFVFRLDSGVGFAQVQSETFTLLAVCEWYNVLNCRSQQRSSLSLDLAKNPWLLSGLLAGIGLQALVIWWSPLSAVFHVVALGPAEIAALFAVGSLVLWAEELRKARARRARRSRVSPAHVPSSPASKKLK